jgi:hypothetical protein
MVEPSDSSDSCQFRGPVRPPVRPSRVGSLDVLLETSRRAGLEPSRFGRGARARSPARPGADRGTAREGPGEANDIVRFFVDGVDQGNRLRECFTTWEQYYRYKELEGPQVTNSLEFRSDGTAALGTLGQGYLFDNVVNTTADGDGPAPTTCGLADDGLIAPTGTTCSQYRDDIAPVLGQLLYNTKGSGINTKINAVSPGVFFYYTRVSGDAGETVGITEDPDGGQAIPVSQSQVVLYDAFTCRVVKDWTPTVNPDGSASGELPTEGDFIIGVKYNPSALKGQEAPASPPITYSFGTTLEGAPFQVESTIDLALKN